jgi:hypothetical protein
MDWNRELDIELITSFMGDMHNWFVFCRNNNTTTDETVSRIKELKASGAYEELRVEARALYEKKKEIWKANAAQLKELIEKKKALSDDEKDWLGKNNI